MTILKNEHLEDEVLNAIRLKAESIMPKDAKVILMMIILIRFGNWVGKLTR